MPPSSTAQRPPTHGEVALRYRDHGWSVVPLCPPDHARCSEHHVEICGSPGKVPLIAWAEFQERAASREQIQHWWRQWPTANVGVATGPVSRLVGIDIDGEPGEDLLAELAGGEEVPPTLEFATGKPQSRRLLYRIPEGHPAPQWPFVNADGATPLTLLGLGGQTVMPPSLHASGGRYRWRAGYSPDEFEIADAPAWLLAHLLRRHEEVESGAGDRPAGYGDGLMLPQGGRNNYMTTVAGAVRRFGCTEEEIRALLHAVNNRCTPALPLHEVNSVARSAMNWPPDGVPRLSELIRRNSQPAGACLISLEDVEPREVTWVWPQWMPAGVLCCLDGDGGVGKTTVAMDLAARITRGAAMPDGTRPTAFSGPQNVLLVCCEDSLEMTIRPRLEAAGADLSRVKYLEEVSDPRTGEVRGLTLPDDIPTLERVVADNGIRFVVFDPILAFMGGENDYSRDQDVRRTIGPLKAIADRYGCTIVYIRHWNKGSQGSKAAYRGGGSLAWVNVARAAFCCGHSPDHEGCGEFHWTKSNLAPRQQGWVYRPVAVGQSVTRIEWVCRSERQADEIASGEPASADERGGAEACHEWLRERLAGSPAASQDVRREARAQGFTLAHLRAAQTRLGLRAEREPGTNRWLWRLPPEPDPTATTDAAPTDGEES